MQLDIDLCHRNIFFFFSGLFFFCRKTFPVDLLRLENCVETNKKLCFYVNFLPTNWHPHKTLTFLACLKTIHWAWIIFDKHCANVQLLLQFARRLLIRGRNISLENAISYLNQYFSALQRSISQKVCWIFKHVLQEIETLWKWHFDSWPINETSFGITLWPDGWIIFQYLAL